MVIDLMAPLWASIVAGIILAVIFGIFRFIIVVVEKETIKKKFFNLISELESLQKSHKNKIASIKEVNLEIIKNITAQKNEEMKNLLDKYHRLVPPVKFAFLEHWENKSKMP